MKFLQVNLCKRWATVEEERTRGVSIRSKNLFSCVEKSFSKEKMNIERMPWWTLDAEKDLLWDKPTIVIMGNNDINRTVSSASVCREQRQSSHSSSMKARIFSFSLIRLVTYQLNCEATTGKMNSSESRNFDEILVILETIVRRVVSNHMDKVKWNKPTFKSPSISLLELLRAKTDSSNIVELSEISVATFIIDPMWRRLHMAFTGFVFSSASISFVWMDIFIYHLHSSHVTSRRARRTSEDDHNWTVRKCFHFIVSSWQIKSQNDVSYWSERWRIRNRLFRRSISKENWLVWYSRCLVVSRNESCRSSHCKTKTNIFLPTKCSSNEKMNDLQRWLRVENAFFSVSCPALLGFGQELVDLDVRLRRWYRKVIFFSFSTKFLLKRAKWMRKIMKQEQVSMCFWILLSFCLVRSCYGKFLPALRFKQRVNYHGKDTSLAPFHLDDLAARCITETQAEKKIQFSSIFST